MVRAFAALGNRVSLVATSMGRAQPRDAGVCGRPAPLGPFNQRLARAHRRGSGGARRHYDVVRCLHNYAFARAGQALGLHAGTDAVYARYSLWDYASVWVAQRLSAPLVLEV